METREELGYQQSSKLHHDDKPKRFFLDMCKPKKPLPISDATKQKMLELKKKMGLIN